MLKRQRVVLGGAKRTPCYALEKKLWRALTRADTKDPAAEQQTFSSGRAMKLGSDSSTLNSLAVSPKQEGPTSCS